MTRRRTTWLAVLAVAATLSACAGVLGIDDLTQVSPDGASPTEDATSDARSEDARPDHVDAGSDSARPDAPIFDGSALEAGAYDTLATALNGPIGIALNSTSVVWAVSGQTGDQYCGEISVLDLAGGTPRTIAKQELYPLAITAENTFAYYPRYARHAFTNIGEVRWARLDADAGFGGTFAVDRDYASAVALAGGTVYWGEKTAIASCSALGCAPDPKIEAPVVHSPGGLAADATSLYWTDPVDGLVMGCTRTACASSVVTLASGQASPQAIAVSGQYVFWTNDGVSNGQGTLARCDRNGCGGAPDVLLAGLDHPRGVATDGTSVYFTARGAEPTFADGWVLKCPSADCAGGITAIAGLQNEPMGVAVDATRVFWTTYGARTGSGLTGCNAASATGTVAAAPK